MIEQDYILLILNCKKYQNKSLHQKKTWLKNINKSLIYYHVVGDENLNKDFIFDDVNNILFVKTKDDYLSLPHKVISAFKAIKETYNFKYIFKTDDDQELIQQNFFETLINHLKINNNIHYGGKLIHIKNHISKYYLVHNELPKNILLKETTYCNGRFYFVSYEAVNNLLINMEKIKVEYFEDYAIGFNLDDYYKTKKININTDLIFKDFFIL